MSEYHDRAAVNKLVRETHDDPGLLGRALANATGGGIPFDEIEKAHPLVLNLYSQILWQGSATVATGEVLRFGNYFVGFTSNVGAADAMRMERFSQPSVDQAVLSRVEQELRPELVGRIDEKPVFTRLAPAVQREICELEVAKETAQLWAGDSISKFPQRRSNSSHAKDFILTSPRLASDAQNGRAAFEGCGGEGAFCLCSGA